MNWGTTTYNMAASGISSWRDRRKQCRASEASKAQCALEDARASANSARAWAKFRENHAVYRNAYNAAKATGEAATKSYETCVSKGNTDRRTAWQRAKDCGSGAASVTATAYQASARAVSNTYNRATQAMGNSWNSASRAVADSRYNPLNWARRTPTATTTTTTTTTRRRTSATPGPRPY